MWTHECQQAFQELNRILSTEPLIIYPGFSKPFIVACDASTKANGAVLSQRRNGKEHPIAYTNRQLNSAESKYSVTELELLAFYLLLNNLDVTCMAVILLAYGPLTFKMGTEPARNPVGSEDVRI